MLKTDIKIIKSSVLVNRAKVDYIYYCGAKKIIKAHRFAKN